MNKIGWVASCLLVAAGVAASAPAVAAYNFLVSVEGMKQGKFLGESLAKGEEGAVPAVAFSFSVRSPRDLATGQASGKRQYSAITFTKAWGASSPQFLASATSNEVLKSVLFRFYKVNADGVRGVYETIKLTNAQVSGVTRRAAAASGSNPTELEDISMTFQRIETNDLVGKTSTSDDWSL